MMGHEDYILECTIKSILDTILDHQSKGPMDDMSDMLGGSMDEMGLPDDMMPDPDGLGVTVMGDDKDEVEDGLEEALEALKDMSFDDLLSKDESEVSPEEKKDFEDTPEDDLVDDEMIKALRKRKKY